MARTLLRSQRVSRELAVRLINHVAEHALGEVFYAPLT